MLAEARENNRENDAELMKRPCNGRNILLLPANADIYRIALPTDKPQAQIHFEQTSGT